MNETVSWMKSTQDGRVSASTTTAAAAAAFASGEEHYVVGGLSAGVALLFLLITCLNRLVVLDVVAMAAVAS